MAATSQHWNRRENTGRMPANQRKPPLIASFEDDTVNEASVVIPYDATPEERRCLGLRCFVPCARCGRT